MHEQRDHDVVPPNATAKRQPTKDSRPDHPVEDTPVEEPADGRGEPTQDAD